MEFSILIDQQMTDMSKTVINKQILTNAAAMTKTWKIWWD